MWRARWPRRSAPRLHLFAWSPARSGAVPALSRRARALLDRRGSRPRLARGGGAHAGRRGQHSDHQVLGRLVEHAASASLAYSHGRLGRRSDHPVATADHGRGIHAAVLHLASRRYAQRNPAPARTQHADHTGAGGARMNLGPHADFIVAAYAVTVFVVAALVAWVILDYSTQRRILGDLEVRGVTRRSQRKDDR